MSQQGRLKDRISDLESLTGNTGGVIVPDNSGNINILGSAPYTVSGNPGTFTLTLTDDGTITYSYTTDSGTAIPSSNVLDVDGGTNINTSGSGNIITINLDSDVLGLTDLTVDNLELNGNILSSTDSNGSIYLFPNGTGGTVINTTLTIGNNVQDIEFTINGSTIDSVVSIESEGATDLGGIIDHRHSNTAAFGGHFIFLRSRGTHDTPTIVQSGDNISRILGCGFDGTDYTQCAEIRIEVDGTPGNNDMPGRIIFLTTPDGSQNPNEAFRISQDQSVTFSGAQYIKTTALNNGDSAYTVLSDDYYMTCDVSAGILEIDLPDSPSTGRVFIVKDSLGNASTFNITVTTVSGIVTIDGSTSFVMNTDYESANFVFNGTSYEVW